MWQLKKLSTNEALSEAGPLPDNWGPIFGMENIKDRIGDLSWLGEAYADQGWVQVEGSSTEPAQSSAAEIAWEKTKKLLSESDWSVLSDVPMDNETRQEWLEYRRELRNIRSQKSFPLNIAWPTKPE